MAEANIQSDWKSSEPTEDTEIYRTSRLEHLESKLKEFDLGLLIDLENECYDSSTSKQTYDAEIQKLVNGLKPSTSSSEIAKPKIPQSKPEVKPSQQIVLIDGMRPNSNKNTPATNNNNNNHHHHQSNTNNNSNSNSTRPVPPAYKPPSRYCDFNNFRRRG